MGIMGSCISRSSREPRESTPEFMEMRDRAYKETRGKGDSDSSKGDIYTAFQEDLITYYRENESQIPVAPLIEEHKVVFEDLYVLPPLWAYDEPYYFGTENKTQKQHKKSESNVPKRHRTTIGQLFLSDKNVRYRKIYITANAGFGKTSLSQKLTMTWCQSHSPLQSLTEKYDDAELHAMLYFDLLFMLHLKDYQGKTQCSLDDLIIKMVSDKLPRKAQYTEEFIQSSLQEKQCLVIFDGLDEWAHPDDCPRKPEVPHNNNPKSCTVLTTTRDWKIGSIGLSPHDIDRRVEILMLDDETREQLEENAIRTLNEKELNIVGKGMSEFDTEIKSAQIMDIICVPYILLQLMCSFFGGLPNASKCEIYSNIIEFTLERGLKIKKLPDIDVQSNNKATVPNIMKENERCIRYFNPIIKLGKLAFFTLFGEKNESSLTFDSRLVTQYLTKEENEFCLKVGLLCQNKDNRILAKKHYNISFQHKSVQEFLAAMYITSEWNKTVKLSISNKCSSLASIIEMSDLFVFVCGMNPKVYTALSSELQKIVDLDRVTCQFRTNMYSDDTRTMKSYQSMQVKCLQESVRNGNKSCLIHLHDILINENIRREDDLTTLKTIINFNKGNVKSLQLTDPGEKIAALIKSLDSGVFTSLQTLRVEDCDTEPVWLADILTKSVRTLKCLTLSGRMIEHSSLIDISIKALTGLKCLQSLYLGYVRMTHSHLECLYDYISRITTLKQLKLKWLSCSDNKYPHRDCDINLDLHHLSELKVLLLPDVQCTELHVNPTCLEKLEFWPHAKMTASASASLCENLSEAPILSSLTLSNISSCREMIQTIPTLTELQFLQLANIDMGDFILRLSSAMTKLERVVLDHVTMSFPAWRELLICEGCLPQAVTVEISSCKGPTWHEWKTIEVKIRSIPSLSLLPDLRVNQLSASLTLSNNHV